VAELPMVLILAGLAAYAVLGGADFGAGLWEIAARGRSGGELREHIHHAMAPVWEANHVWLVFVLVICWTAYPTAFASIASTLSIPLFIATVGIILRGTSYALRSGDPGPREEGALSVVFSLSSILTPFALGAAAGAIASGRVPVGNAGGEEIGSWINPTSLLVGALAVVSAAYMAAVYLAGDARRADLPEMASLFRARALKSGVLVGAVALAGPLVLRADARPLYDGLSSGVGLAAGFVSGAAGVTALALVYRGHFDLARASAAGAVTAIIAGWGLAQQPSFLPGLTVEQAAAGHATLVAIAVAAAVGFVVLAPSLTLLFRLVLTGRFDAGEEEPSVERVTGPSHPARIVRPAVVGVTAGVGAVLALVGEGWLVTVGLVAMLAGASLAFLLLASPEEEET
jgi:cytochrome bd ubiquinol oxidase subunit II